MKFCFKICLVLFAFSFISKIYSQNFEVNVLETFLYDTLGSEIIFDFEVVNISADTQIVFEVRKINDLPVDWQSSLCFGLNCFPPDMDSVVTFPPFPEPPLPPGDTLLTSLHVYTQNNNGTAHVQIQVGTFENPEDRDTIDFTATTIPVSVNEDKNSINNYFLSQNYPNPFNPSTRIAYYIGEPGRVQLKVYNILGVEVVTLVNEYQNSGSHSVDFDASKLSSGVYLYSLSVNNFTQTRKMILEK